MGEFHTIQTVVTIAGVAGLAVFLVIGLLKTFIVEWLAPKQPAKLTRKQIEGIVKQIIWSSLTIAVLSLLVWGTTRIVDSNNQTAQNVAATSGQVGGLRRQVADLQTELETNENKGVSMTKELADIHEKLDRITEPSLKEQIPGYEIIERVVVFDLTRWQPVSPDRRATDKDCTVVTRSIQRVVKVKNEAKFAISTYATSGTWDPAFACTTHNLSPRRNNDRLPVGKPNLRRWLLEFDISSEPIYEEFIINHSITTWNSFQDLVGEFAETLITHPCKTAIIEVELPPSMVYATGSIRGGKYPLGPPLTLLSDEEATIEYIESKHTVRMVVHEPRLGMHYRLMWQWSQRS